jgi:hypothetical protein
MLWWMRIIRKTLLDFFLWKNEILLWCLSWHFYTRALFVIAGLVILLHVKYHPVIWKVIQTRWLLSFVKNRNWSSCSCMELWHWTPIYHNVAVGLSILIDQNLKNIFFVVFSAGCHFKSGKWICALEYITFQPQ